MAFDTDVNAAALGEWRWGAARELDTFVYLTIGTGIGGGGLVGGQLMHGLVHPEMGHLRLPRDAAADPFSGRLPVPRRLPGGTGQRARAARALGLRPPRRCRRSIAAWALEARYLALALVNLICTLSPQRIVMGGGVMDQSHLLPLVRREVKALLNDYVRAPEILEDIDGYVVPPALGGRAGVLGALALAARSTPWPATAST